jgi:hypothetical protein
VREAVQGVVTRLEPGAMVLAVADSERTLATTGAEPDLDVKARLASLGGEIGACDRVVRAVRAPTTSAPAGSSATRK